MKRRSYPEIVEAYNYCVGYFCESSDFSFRPSGTKLAIPFNQNDLLELLVNRILIVREEHLDLATGRLEISYRGPRAGEQGQSVEIKRVGKYWFEKHLINQTTLFHRSKYNCTARTGYHGYDGARDKHPWMARFGIDSKVNRYDGVGWLLLGIDLDAKNGEQDVQELCHWLVQEYFHGSYHEPSTGGKGIHLYLKVAYRKNMCGDHYSTILHVTKMINKLAVHLEGRRVGRYESQIDGIRSLPTLFAFSEAKGRVVVSTRSNCIKAPRCDRGMDDIYQFHVAPMILFDALEDMVRRFDSIDASISSVSPSQHVLEAQEMLGTEIDSAEMDGNGLTTALPSSTTNVCTPNGGKYTLERIKAEPNALARKRLLVWWRRRLDGAMKTIDEYLDLYHQHGLAGGERDGEQQREMQAAVRYVQERFDDERCFDLSNFENSKRDIEGLMGKPKLTYRKEKDRVRQIPFEMVWAVYYVICEECWQSDGTVSQEQLKDFTCDLLGRKAHRNQIQAIINWLVKKGFIEKASAPVWGAGKFNKGTGWRLRASSNGCDGVSDAA